MMAAPFCESIALQQIEPGRWSGETDPDYANGFEGVLVGQFGGWVGAAMLKAACGEAPEHQRPRALAIHFLSPVRPGAIELRVAPLRQGRSVSFLQVELRQGADVRAHAVATLGQERPEAPARTMARFPEAAGPETPGLGQFAPPTPFGRALTTRWVEGEPFQGADGAHSLFWTRTAKPARLDACMLALLADYMPPRLFYVTNGFVPSATLSMTIYFHGKQDEIDAVGKDYILTEVAGRRVGAGYWDHSVKHWSAGGALLATTEQIALHRGPR